MFKEQLFDTNKNPVAGATVRISYVCIWDPWCATMTDDKGWYCVEIPEGREGSACDVRVYNGDVEIVYLAHQITLINNA